AAPTLTLPGAQLAQQNAALTVAGVSVADSDAISANETITAALTASGVLAANTNAANGGGNVTGSGTHSLQIVGTLTQVNADLSTLTITESALAGDTIQVSASDGRGGSAGPQGITVNVNAPPVVT